MASPILDPAGLAAWVAQETAAMENQMKHDQQYKHDLECLDRQLSTLADETTRSAMIPLGKLAFMPGQLIHTNEILVLLGDEYYVERSTKQARDMLKRRQEVVNENINLLQGKLNASRSKQLTTLEKQGVNEEGLPVMDIREPLPDTEPEPQHPSMKPSDPAQAALEDDLPPSVKRAREMLSRTPRTLDKKELALLDWMDQLEKEEQEELEGKAEGSHQGILSTTQQGREENETDEETEDEDDVSEHLLSFQDDDDMDPTVGMVEREDMTLPDEEEDLETDESSPSRPGSSSQKPHVSWDATATVREHNVNDTPKSSSDSPVYTTPLKKETSGPSSIRSPADLFRVVRQQVRESAPVMDDYPSLDDHDNVDQYAVDAGPSSALDLGDLAHAIRNHCEPIFRPTSGDDEAMWQELAALSVPDEDEEEDTEPRGPVLQGTVIERESVPVDQDRVEDDMDMREITNRYQQHRQRWLAAAGGFSVEPKPEFEVVEEELPLPSHGEGKGQEQPPDVTSTTPPKKMSRFKAARLGLRDSH